MMFQKECEQRTCLMGVTSSISLQFVRPLADYLATRGWEVGVVASFEGSDFPSTDVAWTEHHLRMARGPNLLRDSVSLIHWIFMFRRFRPLIFIAGTPKAGLLGLAAARLCGVRYRVLVLHGLRTETLSSPSSFVLRFFERMTSQAATEVLAVSQSLREKYVLGGFAHESKIRVLGKGSAVGVNETRFEAIREGKTRKQIRAQIHSELGLDPRNVTFGYVGRIARDKGIFHLIEALQILVAKGHRVQCLIVGTEEDRGMLRGVSSLPHARVLPWTADIAPIYCSIDVLCLPSFREGMPTVVLEAALMAIPTIGARSTGIVDAIMDGETGLIVNQKDSDSLAEGMIRLAQNPELRVALGGRAQQHARSHFAEEDVLNQYFNHLDELVNTPGRATPRTRMRKRP